MNWHVVFGFIGTFLIVGFILFAITASDSHDRHMVYATRRAIVWAIVCAVLASLFWGLVFV